MTPNLRPAVPSGAVEAPSREQGVEEHDERLLADAGRGAVLDAEIERGIGPQAAEVEIGVAEGVQVARAPEAVAGAAPGGSLAGMVDEQDGAVGGAREGAEAVEDDGHLRGGVLAGAVQADEGVEDEEGGRR